MIDRGFIVLLSLLVGLGPRAMIGGGTD